MKNKRKIESDNFLDENQVEDKAWDGELVLVEYNCVFDENIIPMHSIMPVKGIPKSYKKKIEYMERLIVAKLVGIGFSNFAQSVMEVTRVKVFKEKKWKKSTSEK